LIFTGIFDNLIKECSPKTKQEELVMTRRIFIGVTLATLAIVGGLIVRAQTTGNTVAGALAKKAAMEALNARGESVGLRCFMSLDFACENLISRAEKNPALKKAFQATQAKGVSVWPQAWPWFSAGSVETGWVEVNMLTSDEKIIAFLTE
jgi:hypothetical protein